MDCMKHTGTPPAAGYRWWDAAQPQLLLVHVDPMHVVHAWSQGEVSVWWFPHMCLAVHLPWASAHTVYHTVYHTKCQAPHPQNKIARNIPRHPETSRACALCALCLRSRVLCAVSWALACKCAWNVKQLLWTE